MRLSWLAQIFSRGKSRATSEGNSPSRYPTDVLAARRGKVPVPALAHSRIPPVKEPGPVLMNLSPIASDGTSAPPPAELALPPAPGPSKASPPREDEMVRATKMAPQEELGIKLNEALKSLSTLLSAIDEKVAQQHRATELVAERLQTLPRVLEGLVEAERTSLETLRDLRTSLEAQGKAANQASQELGKLPGLVDTIGSRIDRQTEAASAMRTSVESVGQSVRGLVDVSQRASNSLITEFRRGQDDQRLRLEELVDRQRRTIWVVAGLGILVVVCLLIVLTRLPK